MSLKILSPMQELFKDHFLIRFFIKVLYFIKPFLNHITLFDFRNTVTIVIKKKKKKLLDTFKFQRLFFLIVEY